MKKSIILAVLFLGSIAEGQTSNPLGFSIKGKVDQPEISSQAVLQYWDGSKLISDTTMLVNGSFAFKGSLSHPVKSTLSIIKADLSPAFAIGISFDDEIIGRDGIFLYLDKGDIRIKGQTLKTAIIKGSAAHGEYQALQTSLNPFFERKKEIIEGRAKLGAGEQSKSQENDVIFAKLLAVSKDMEPIQNDFIKSHLNSYVSWDLITARNEIFDAAMQKELLDLFPENLRNSHAGKAAFAKQALLSKTAIGRLAPLFTQNDPKGKPVLLASLKGKYVLIDFWASWCAPCRLENPNLKRVYDKFRDNNFEIIAVSLDEKKDLWLKAIADDGLPWLHVSDLKGWKNEVGMRYAVSSVPQNILIDPDGVIISKNLRGVVLENKLSEIFKEKLKSEKI
ncbi:Peroxiredoxin [Pedobacter steynii]|uniref:Peroxiredoxin n=2 Tax=Pedobacter steynii TaxID=430522 RepID=A0A1G9K8G3_9SPHI|nr:Peroxiredoxin [Pedobacter steynii]